MKTKYDLSEFINIPTKERVIKDLISRVKERRKELNLTQKELAEKSGVSYASIRRFETTGEISFTSLLKIAEVINCLSDFDNLFNREIIKDLRCYRHENTKNN